MSKTALIMENIAVLAPIPRAVMSTEKTVNPGLLRNMRRLAHILEQVLHLKARDVAAPWLEDTTTTSPSQ